MAALHYDVRNTRVILEYLTRLCLKLRGYVIKTVVTGFVTGARCKIGFA